MFFGHPYTIMFAVKVKKKIECSGSVPQCFQRSFITHAAEPTGSIGRNSPKVQ